MTNPPRRFCPSLWPAHLLQGQFHRGLFIFVADRGVGVPSVQKQPFFHQSEVPFLSNAPPPPIWWCKTTGDKTQQQQEGATVGGGGQAGWTLVTTTVYTSAIKNSRNIFTPITTTSHLLFPTSPHSPANPGTKKRQHARVLPAHASFSQRTATVATCTVVLCDHNNSAHERYKPGRGCVRLTRHPPR